MQCSGEMRAAMHHGAKKSACRNTPPVRWATLKTSDNASISAFLSGSGVSVMSPGGPAIELPPSVALPMAAAADRFVEQSAQSTEQEMKDECDQQNFCQRSVCALYPNIQAGALGPR